MDGLGGCIADAVMQHMSAIISACVHVFKYDKVYVESLHPAAAAPKETVAGYWRL